MTFLMKNPSMLKGPIIGLTPLPSEFRRGDEWKGRNPEVSKGVGGGGGKGSRKRNLLFNTHGLRRKGHSL